MDRVYLQWDIQNLDASSPVPTFSVDRSATGTGDWETLASGITDLFYIDVFSGTPHILAAGRTWYYRVGLTDSDPSEPTRYSDAVDQTNTTRIHITGDDRLGIVARQDAQRGAAPHGPFHAGAGQDRRLIQAVNVRARQHAMLRERFVGYDCAILVRRRFGARCPSCYSRQGRGAVLGKCVNCYGTGWDGGYHTPIFDSVLLRAGGEQQAIRPGGKTQARRGRASLGTFPLLQQDDLLVNMHTDERWRILDRDPRILDGVRYKQKNNVELLPRSGVEYRIPISRQRAWVLSTFGRTV
jgi:hypothetical protein